MIQHGSRVFFQLIPLVFFLWGIGPLPASEGQEILDYQLPFILAVTSCMFLLMRPFYLPLFTEAMSLFSAFALLPELLQSLIKPYGKGFRVTPKGTAAADVGQTLFRQTLLPSCALVVMNVVVLLQVSLGLSEASSSVGSELALYGTIWCAINIALLVMCILMSLERHQPPLEHRISVNRPARMLRQDGSALDGVVEDLSMSGARFRSERTLELPAAAPEGLELELKPGLQLPLKRAWHNRQGELVMAFADLDLTQQKRLIGYAFSGEFLSAEQPRSVQLRRTFQQLWQTILG